MLNEIARILYFIRSNWYNKSGLLVTTILALVLLKSLFGSTLERFIPSQFWCLPYLSLSGIIILCWVSSRSYYPTNKKNKVGILIAIHTENERDEIQIKNDFIKDTKNLISSRSLDSIFNTIVLNNYKSERVQTSQQAIQISDKTKSHFIIWGIFKKRQHRGHSTCVFNLQALVRHAPIKDLATRTKFAREFNEIFPRQIRFPDKEELLGFELTTSIIHEASVYLIGIATLISRDPLLSLELHSYLYERIKKETLIEKISQLKIIKQRLPKLLAQEHLHLAEYYYTSRQNKDMNKVKEHSQAALKYNREAYNGHLFLAIYYFFQKKPRLASEEVKKAKRIAPRNGAVRYSEAFLYFYSRNFRKADIAYRKALRTSTPSQTLLQVESFITDVLEQEPDKTYLHYPLGLINYRVKDDYVLAAESFQKFVELCKDDLDLAEQIRKAKIFLKELASKKTVRTEEKTEIKTIT